MELTPLNQRTLDICAEIESFVGEAVARAAPAFGFFDIPVESYCGFLPLQVFAKQAYHGDGHDHLADILIPLYVASQLCSLEEPLRMEPRVFAIPSPDISGPKFGIIWQTLAHDRCLIVSEHRSLLAACSSIAQSGWEYLEGRYQVGDFARLQGQRPIEKAPTSAKIVMFPSPSA